MYVCVCVCVTKRELLKQVCDESNCEAPAAYRISFYVLNATGKVECDPCVAPLEGIPYTLHPLSFSFSINPKP